MLCMLVGVGNAWGADKWVKTAAADLQTGDIIAIVDETSSTALSNNNGTNSAPSATAVTISDEEIAEVAGSLQWEVTITDGSYQFKVPETSNYLYCTNTNNGVRVGTNSNNAFTITTGGDDNADFLVNTATSRYIGVYNNQDWRCYTSINNNIKGCVTAFYKFVADQSDTREVVNLSFSSTTVLAKLGETFTAPTLTIDPTDALNDVIYTSDNPEAATVGDDGSVTIVGVGTAKITASIDENSTNYKGESKSYIIGVIANAGTESSPYTVADAHAAIDANDGITNIYATGIVSEIVTAYNATYGNITYNISVDGTTTADQLQAYRGKSYNGENFTSADDIQVGDEVVIYGNLKKHNSTYEFDANNQLVSLNRPTAAVEKPEFSPAGGNFEEAQSVTITCATDGATIYYTLDGTEPTASSTEYTAPIQVSSTTTIKAIAVKGSDVSTVAEATYTILVLKTIAEVRTQETGTVETKGVVTSISGKNAYIQDATAAILVYGNSDITDLAVGDEIKVSGELATYNGLLEIKNPTYTVLSQNNTVNPTVMTIADINASDAPQSWLIRIEEATVSLISGQNVTLAQGENTVVVRFNVASDITFSVNDVVSLTGNIGCYNTVQIANPRDITVIENTDPVINASDVTLAYDATSGAITYSIENPVTGSALEASTDAEWISNIVVDAAAITFTTTANEGTEDREAIITLSYTGAESKTVTVTQEHYVVDYAELPFEFDGGKADIEGTNGLTQSGLGSDYSSAPKLKFDGSGDEMVLKFNEQPGILTFNIKGNSFSGGTFKVQTSADGVTYTDLETYTTLGDTQSEEFDNIATDVRYIKWVYTEKVNGNVALGNITLAKYTAKYAVNIDETITNGAVTADKTEAPEGATVTLTVEPAEGYVLDVLTVTGESGTAVDVENSTFVMPAEPVTVSATFTKAPVITDGYKKVTSTEDLTDGEYLIVYESSSVAFNGGLETLDAVSNTISVEISNNIIPSSTEVDAATFTIDVTAGTLKSKSGKYIGVSSNSNGLNQTEEAGTYTHTFSIDEDGNAVISAVFDESTMALRFNKTSGQTRFRYFKNAGQEAIQLYKKFTSSEFLAGDVNGDNQVSIADVTALVNIILGKATPESNPEYNFEAANVNGDDDISIADVTALVNIILGKE